MMQITERIGKVMGVDFLTATLSLQEPVAKAVGQFTILSAQQLLAKASGLALKA